MFVTHHIQPERGLCLYFSPLYDVILRFYQRSNTCVYCWHRSVLALEITVTTSLYWLLSHPVKRRESTSGAYCSTQKNLWQIEIKFTFQVKKVKPVSPRRPQIGASLSSCFTTENEEWVFIEKGTHISWCRELKKDLIIWRTLQRLRQISEHLRTIWRHPYFLRLLKIDKEKRRSLRGCCYCYEIYCVLFLN